MSISLSLIFLDASAISVVPSIREAIPTPEPPPCTDMFIPWFCSMKTSAVICAIGSTVVDPFMVRSGPAATELVPDVAINNAAAQTLCSILRENICNLMKTSVFFSFIETLC